MKQKTLKNSFSVSGKGLHTGLEITATFLPAPEHHGYKIQRIDLEGQPIIEALAENVVETSRGTVIAEGDARDEEKAEERRHDGRDEMRLGVCPKLTLAWTHKRPPVGFRRRPAR